MSNIRPFAGVQTIGAASQPVFGTTMNGAGVMTMDPHTLRTNPASQASSTVLPLTSTKGFRVGDRVLVGPKANFVFQGSLDQGTVDAVVAGTSITVLGLLIAHASGEYVVLNEDAMTVSITSGTMAGVYYLGTDSTVSSTDASVFAAKNPGSDYNSPPGIADTQKTAEYWIFGTAADTFTASFNQV